MKLLLLATLTVTVAVAGDVTFQISKDGKHVKVKGASKDALLIEILHQYKDASEDLDLAKALLGACMQHQLENDDPLRKTVFDESQAPPPRQQDPREDANRMRAWEIWVEQQRAEVGKQKQPDPGTLEQTRRFQEDVGTVVKHGQKVLDSMEYGTVDSKQFKQFVKASQKFCKEKK